MNQQKNNYLFFRRDKEKYAKCAMSLKAAPNARYSTLGAIMQEQEM